ncbi:FMN-binding negative transcriptional regulator [Solirubrobacter sp. CPCC 204708]|uniref:FMN-binding negative transcriptional regulator n=1 Tax=Solirubrobacter deserti TaxID=2282478 RepID=A0ABT4RHQ6_9ACTN|nr:FMN-binding negative transcriptional regulator [Solirubrobacter deserti]MBE2316529.1 FMN-binding negative transcriptional regulator [Solirubrobacter deserti]MDA0138063.1 FMN-binding negative transcriptional regulator [Solirubrobacter deserti]
MRIKNAFRVADVTAAREIVRAHALGTFVTPDLQITRMPCLLEEELTIVSHVAHADPFCAALGGPLLAIFSGPQGYISASWYEQDTIPTWNNVTVYVRGTAECFDDALPTLRRTVDHFEAAVQRPWSLDRLEDGGRAMADKVTAFRLRPEAWWAEAKLSQDKPADERARLIAALQAPGPYQDAALAEAMRQA